MVGEVEVLLLLLLLLLESVDAVTVVTVLLAFTDAVNHTQHRKVKVAHTRLPSIGFRS